MPFYLKASDITSQVDGLRSVLIVPCRFCPAVSLAVKKKKPFINLFRNFLRTEAYEEFIVSLKSRLMNMGINAVVFDSKWPQHYVACMWPAGRREKLANLAKDFDGVVVLGCQATVESLQDAVTHSKCRVIQGMEIEGLMNLLPHFRFPCTISLSVQNMTPVSTEASMR